MGETLILLIILVLAFGPPLLYMRWFRNFEKVEREPWKAMGQSFAWGAMGAVFVAVFLSMTILSTFGYLYRDLDETTTFIIAAIVVAPFVEEAAKAWGISRKVRGEVGEVEDGLVYGAACGLGFSATENLLYGLFFYYEEGSSFAITLLIGRALSSTLLHASATAMTGHGYGRYKVEGADFSIVVRYYLVAVFMHAGFNAAALTGTWYGLVVAIALALGGVEFAKRRIRELDGRRSQMQLDALTARQPTRENWWQARRAQWQRHSGAHAAHHEAHKAYRHAATRAVDPLRPASGKWQQRRTYRRGERR